MSETLAQTTEPAPPVRRFRLSRSDILVILLLGLALLLGGYARLMANNWDDFVRFHPDERYLTGSIAPKLGGQLATCNNAGADCQEFMQRVNACRQKYPESSGRGPFFDAQCSPYNPENVDLTQFVYGTLPLFAARLSAEAVVDVTGDPGWTSYSGLFQVWRALSAGADTLVILLVFLIGRRAFNRWVGLTAAILYAASVFPIQQAHFGTNDAITALFVTMGLYFMVRLQDTDSLWDYAGFGLALGAAVASRINVAPLAFVLAVPILLRMLPGFDPRLPWRERSYHLYSPVIGGLLAAFVSLLVFRVANPYAFTGPGFFGLEISQRFLDALSQAQYNVSGQLDWAPNWQWVNRTSFLFPLKNIIIWGMGIALGLAAWLGFIWALWRLVRGRPRTTRPISLVIWVLGYFLFVGDLWVMSMRYYLPLYAPLAILAAWMLYELARWGLNHRRVLWRVVAVTPYVVVLGFTILWALMFTNIYRNQATFVQSGHYTWEQVPGDFYMEYADAPDDAPLLNIGLRNQIAPPGTSLENKFLYEATRIMPGTGASSTFTAPQSGEVAAINAHRIAAVTTDADDTFASQQEINYDSAPRTVEVTVSDSAGNTVATATVEDTALPAEAHPLGEALRIPFESSFTVEEGAQYRLNVNVEGGMVITSGAIMASELPWDEPVPPPVCDLPPGVTLADDPPPGLVDRGECVAPAPWNSLVHIFNLNLAGEDTVTKRDQMETILNQTDYVIVNTNRRYDSQSRIPKRWPLTNTYYDALFGGNLGFELERRFQETFELGPLKVSDQYLPYYDSPSWLNEFEAEEAFTVYDHPVVMFFRKSEDYDPLNTKLVLESVPLNTPDQVAPSYDNAALVNVLRIPSLQADKAPTHLMLTDSMEETQEDGGTWHERFFPDSPLVGNQVLGAVAWWLVIMAFGLAAWPLLFAAFPGLADRGYGFAKMLGMTLVAWGTWVLATIRLPVWNQGGVLAGLVVLAGLSAYIAWRQRGRLIGYVRTRWRLLLTIEVLALLLYVAFILVRLTNPDLWHPAYGGEKPMDFAYFNGVLRSTIFPPIDPWFADGYINYYYFGFVIVGAPTLVTGIVPSVAYNLIIPTLFSLTGIAAFAVAFNVASAWRTRSETPATRKRPLGNPWVAGFMALLLAVVLGNLDTARVFGRNVAQMGGYTPNADLVSYYQEQLVESSDGLTGGTQNATSIMQQAQEMAANAGPLDRFGVWLDNTGEFVSGLVRGTGNLLVGQSPNIDPSRWFWAPTRIITEIPNQNDGAINEMPYFTFLYGDLHAHMISMPLMLFALAFVFHEVVIAGRERRRFWGQLAALFLGGAVVGLFQAVNTWDYPTFLILSVLGLGYAWWLTWRAITRWSLLNMVVRIGGFMVLSWLAALPFTWWFASGLTRFKFWEGKPTPLWAYLDIHGLFLFILVSLLVWETARWMAAVHVRDLRGKLWLLWTILGGAGLVLAFALILALIGYPIALVVVPLVVWVGLLFFRPGQSRAMQYVLVLAGLALTITMGTELITLANDNGRQNTVFKFYLQVWLLLSIVGGVGLAWVVSNSERWRPRLAVPWYGVFALLFFIAALYPLMATRGKAAYRMAPQTPVTLDGQAYMRHAAHFESGLKQQVELVHDYNAIRWLQDNVEGSPTIIEAISGQLLYQWGGRISINTGLPSVIGWDYHQRQQRSVSPLPRLVGQRIANVNAFYNTNDIAEAVKILRHYDVRYVIVTSYERQRYGLSESEQATGMSSGLDKFDNMVDMGLLDVAYQEGEATIYAVRQQQLDQAFLAQLQGDFTDMILETGAE